MEEKTPLNMLQLVSEEDTSEKCFLPLYLLI